MVNSLDSLVKKRKKKKQCCAGGDLRAMRLKSGGKEELCW